MVDKKNLDCRGGAHSDDVVLVFTGRAEPRRMCGYHVAQQEAGRRLAEEKGAKR